MSFESLLNKTCDIYSDATSGVDSFNQPVSAPVLVHQDWPCRLDSKRMSTATGEQITPGELTIAEFILYLPIDTTINEGYSVVISSKTYDVLLVVDAGGAGHHLEVDLRLVK